MKRGLWKFWALILPLICLIGACSGGAGNADNFNQKQDANLRQETAIDTNKLIADWAGFIGIDPAEAEESLKATGVFEKLGKNTPLNSTEFSLYLNLVFEKDNTFSGQIRAMNAANRQLFTEIRVSRSVFGGGDPEVLQDQYAALTERAKALRQRVENGAQILGLLLQGADTSDLLLDNDFAPIKDAFVEPLMPLLFNVPFSNFPNLEQQKVAELLTAVTFDVAGSFLCFYSFTGFSPEDREELANARTPIVLSRRGTFEILAAIDNPFLANAFNSGGVIGGGFGPVTGGGSTNP